MPLTKHTMTAAQALAEAESARLGNNLKKADQIYAQLLQTSPTLVPALIGQGLLYLHARKYPQAVASAAKAIKHDPKAIEAYRLACMALNNSRQTLASLDWCENGLKHAPNDPFLTYQKARLHAMAGNLRDAKDLCAKAAQGADARTLKLIRNLETKLAQAPAT